MSNADFEYAIKTDIRNNPIVREVDEARQRQMRRSLAIGALLVAVALFSAWQNYALVQHGYELQALQEKMQAEEIINRRLRLEIETLSSPAHIEELASRLKLVAPGAEEAIVIERVVPAAPPGASVVARAGAGQE
jgi:cell division protein FtsL